MAGLVPAISIIEAPPDHVETPCPHYRDRRDRPGDDVRGASISSEHALAASLSLCLRVDYHKSQVQSTMLTSSLDDRPEKPMEHLKRIADEFGRQAETFEVWAERTDDQAAARFLAALGRAGEGDLLDVACGPGVVTAAIAPKAASVVALDATEEMLEKARARCAKAGLHNVSFEHGDAENIPFPDSRFDGVVTRLAVHHFADPSPRSPKMVGPQEWDYRSRTAGSFSFIAGACGRRSSPSGSPRGHRDAK
jgi:tRNA G46 methylase TrmB